MSTQRHLTDTPFTNLPLHPNLLSGLEKAGFEKCTPIQAETLPRALAGEDVAGQAQTGTGKTAAFLLATLHHLLTHDAPRRDTDAGSARPRALILAPTRELAVQIHHDALPFSEAAGLKLGLAFGGTGYTTQREQIEAGIDVLIGTPGRLIDYYKQKVFTLKALEVAVLDEADRMFDLGFIKDIRYLFRRMPPADQRLNMLFSATLSYRVLELAYEHMNSPSLVRIESESVTADRVRERLYHVGNAEKISLLLGLMQREEPPRALVFVNTKRAGERLEAYLNANGRPAAVLSGDVPQKKRLRLLRDFQEGKLATLVATDVAARGLHIPDVSHVFNFDLPQDAEDYVHRIGRTARAGKAGEAISLCCETYVYSLPAIEEFIGHKIPAETQVDDLMIEPKRPAGGKRPSGKGKHNDRGRRRRGSGRKAAHGKREDKGNPAQPEQGAKS